MDENVLIVSKVSKSYIIFTKIVILIFSLAWITFLVLGVSTAVIKRNEFKRKLISEAFQSDPDNNGVYECYGSHYDVFGDRFHSDTKYFNTEKDFWNHYKEEHHKKIVSLFDYGEQWFELNFLFLILAAFQIFKLYAYYKNKIIVTTEKVYAKTVFGAKIILPIDKITAYGATKIFSRIAIHAIRGSIMLTFVANNWEIMEVVNKLINERNSNITTA